MRHAGGLSTLALAPGSCMISGKGRNLSAPPLFHRQCNGILQLGRHRRHKAVLNSKGGNMGDFRVCLTTST